MRLCLIGLLSFLSLQLLIAQVQGKSDSLLTKKSNLLLYRLKNNSVDTLLLSRVVLIETDTLSFIGEPISREDSMLVFKSSTGIKTRIDLNHVAGIGYCRSKTQDKYIQKFRKKGALLSNLPSYIAGGIGIAGLALAFTDRHVSDFMDINSNRSVTKIATGAIAVSVGYMIFNFSFHRSKIKYYDINSRWSVTPVIP